jgi:hypothetical protein
VQRSSPFVLRALPGTEDVIAVGNGRGATQPPALIRYQGTGAIAAGYPKALVTGSNKAFVFNALVEHPCVAADTQGNVYVLARVDDPRRSRTGAASWCSACPRAQPSVPDHLDQATFGDHLVRADQREPACARRGYDQAIEGVLQRAEQGELGRVAEIERQNTHVIVALRRGIELRNTDYPAPVFGEQRELDTEDGGEPRACEPDVHVAERPPCGATQSFRPGRPPHEGVRVEHVLLHLSFALRRTAR